MRTARWLVSTIVSAVLFQAVAPLDVRHLVIQQITVDLAGRFVAETGEHR